jgi:hypothetical protein
VSVSVTEPVSQQNPQSKLCGKKRLCIEPKWLVNHLAVGKSGLPGEAEFVLEFGSRHGDLGRRQDGGLGGDGVVVLVDVHAGVDLLAGELALGDDLDTLLGESGGHQCLSLLIVGVRLHEHIGAVYVLGAHSSGCDRE